MGIAILMILLQAAGLHDAGDILIMLFLGHDAMFPNTFTNDLGDGQTGRQAGIGVLEDDLDIGTVLPQFGLAQTEDLGAVEVDFAIGLFLQAQDGLADGGLAAAGLADQTHGGTTLDLERDAVNGLHMADGLLKEAGLDGEILFQILDNQQILGILFCAVEAVERVSAILDFFRHIKAPPHS